jgi:hypothetical protein
VFRHALITDRLVTSLNPDITLKEIADELYIEIGYPR